jgi:antitoxin YefM
MAAIALAQLRKKLTQVIDQASEEAVVITRADGRGMVILPKSEYDSMRETLHLVSSKANIRALKRSIAQIRRGDTVKVKIG